MFGYLPQYCERSGPGLMAEPLNLVSNLAFLLAAWVLARSRAWRDGGWDTRFLVVWVAVIGFGSALWHATARPWALWADVLPIGVFMAGYLAFFLARVAGLGVPAVVTGLLIFAAIEAGLFWTLGLEFLDGAVLYPPAVLAVWLMALFLYRRQAGEWRGFVLAGILLALAIASRVVDRAICASIPFGSHFLWHLLAAPALYLLVRGGVSAMRRARHADSLP